MQSAVLPSIVTLSGVERVSIGTLSAYILTLSGDIVLFKVHRVESGLLGAKLSSRIVQQSLLNRVCGTKNYENMFLSPISHDPPRCLLSGSIGLHRTSTVIVGSHLYFVSMAQSKGFSAKDAATFVTVAGVGHLITRTIQGFILDRWVKSYCIPMVILITIASAMFYATPWLTWYWSLMVSSVLTLSYMCAVLCLFDVLYKQLLGVNLLAGTIGWAGIQFAIIKFSLVFLPGRLDI